MAYPLLTAAAPLMGGIASGLFGRSSARKSMSFQREMAKKAHQYEVADLRAAGLNPILSGTGGAGARASGGAMPSTPDFGSSAISSLRLQKEIALLNAQTEGAQNKADIDAPEAFVGKEARALLDAGKIKLQKTKVIPNTSAKQISIQDSNARFSESGYKDKYGGFKKTLKPRYQRRVKKR